MEKTETKIEKVMRELSDLYNFYKKIPKVKKSKNTYASDSNSGDKTKSK